MTGAHYDPPSPFPVLRSRWDIVRFIALAVRITTITTLRWLGGSWWAPVMLREFVDLAYARCVDTSYVAVAYFFPSQFMSRRPLWSWFVEQKGAKVCKVFYSHNFQTTFMRDEPDLPMSDPIYSLMRWSQVVYLTEQCGPFMEAVGATPHQHIVGGVIGFVDQGGLPPKV